MAKPTLCPCCGCGCACRLQLRLVCESRGLPDDAPGSDTGCKACMGKQERERYRGCAERGQLCGWWEWVRFPCALHKVWGAAHTPVLRMTESSAKGSPRFASIDKGTVPYMLPQSQQALIYLQTRESSEIQATPHPAPAVPTALQKLG